MLLALDLHSSQINPPLSGFDAIGVQRIRTELPLPPLALNNAAINRPAGRAPIPPCAACAAVGQALGGSLLQSTVLGDVWRTL